MCIKVKILLCLLLFSFGVYSQNYSLKILERPYQELENANILCKDSIPRRTYFTLDTPISVLNEEVDSIFIVDLKVLHIGLGNKNSKEFDMFVPLSCPIKKLKIDSTGFSISYIVTGEVGKRKVVIQWKGVRPDYSYSDNDAINLQVIIDEEKNTVSYTYGKLLPFFELILSVWTNNRQLSIYFVDDIQSLNDVKFDVKYIAKSILPPHDFAINTAYITGGAFNDFYVSSKIPYDHDGIEIAEGLNFIIGEDINSSVQEHNEIKTTLYPNPASNELFILSEQATKTNYEVFNTSGIKLQSGFIKNNTINIEQLSPGLHVLKWMTESGEVRVGKFYKR